MIARDAESTRKPGRPQPYKRPLTVSEGKFALCLRSADQSHSHLRRIDSPGAHTLEEAVEPKCVEDIAGALAWVAACFQVFETPDGAGRNIDARVEPGDDRKRRACV
jgi:hypothetical protein